MDSFNASILFETPPNNCLIFKQITGFDVVTDLFFENFNLNEKKSCNSSRVDSN